MGVGLSFERVIEECREQAPCRESWNAASKGEGAVAINAPAVEQAANGA